MQSQTSERRAVDPFFGPELERRHGENEREGVYLAHKKLVETLDRLNAELPIPRIIDRREAAEDYRAWRFNLMARTTAMAEFLYDMTCRTSASMVGGPALGKDEFIGLIEGDVVDGFYKADERVDEIEDAEARRGWEDMRAQGVA